MTQKTIYLQLDLFNKFAYHKSVVTALAEIMKTGVNPATQQVDAPRIRRFGEKCQKMA
jgi:hypothetical protein